MIFNGFRIEDHINPLETLPTLYQTLLQTLDKNTFRQVLSDKNDFAAPCLGFPPLPAQVAAHGLMHSLKNHLAGGTLHPKHPFVAQHARSVDLDQAAQKFFETGRIEGAIAAKDKCRNIIRMTAAMMMVVMVVLVMVAMIIAVVFMIVRV